MTPKLSLSVQQSQSPRFESGFGYRARADARAVGGGQPESTFATVAEAREWKSVTEARVADGTFVGKSRVTVESAIQDWCDGQRGAKNTAAARTAALAPVIAAVGTRRVQSISKRDVEKVLDRLVAGEIDGIQKRSISYTNRTRTLWQSCWADLLAQGVLARNVVSLVKPLSSPEEDEQAADCLRRRGRAGPSVSAE